MKICDLTLNSLCRKYHYDISGESIIIFAFRGSYPLQSMGSNPHLAGKPEKVKSITEKKVNYQTAACSIGIWFRYSGDIAIFPGSTVPSLKYMHQNPGSVNHFNLLCPGQYKYVRGIHPRNISGYQRHDALIMPGSGWIMRPQIIRKTRKSLFNFNLADYHIIFPGDNLHASRTEPHLSIDNTPVINSNFSSSGCLTVMGQPEEYVRSSYSFFWNSWEQFMKLLVSSSSKQKYTLLLFNFSDLTGIGKNGQHTILRFGSQGSQVTELQSILSEIYSTKTDSPYYTGSHDGLLEADTARAWLRFMNDYSPGSIKGETDINEFRSKTSHFIFTIKRYEHVIY